MARGRRDPERERFWRGALRRQAVSGLTVRAFCAKEGLAETVNSMIKRNLGSALAGRTARSRKRNLRLKALTHNLMVLRPWVETEQVRSHSCRTRQLRRGDRPRRR